MSGGGPRPSWQANAKWWCKFCRTFVYDNAIQRKRHEATERHIQAQKQYVDDVYRRQAQRDDSDSAVQTELERIEQAAVAAYQQHDAAREAPPPPPSVSEQARASAQQQPRTQHAALSGASEVERAREALGAPTIRPLAAMNPLEQAYAFAQPDTLDPGVVKSLFMQQHAVDEMAAATMPMPMQDTFQPPLPPDDPPDDGSVKRERAPVDADADPDSMVNPDDTAAADNPDDTAADDDDVPVLGKWEDVDVSQQPRHYLSKVANEDDDHDDRAEAAALLDEQASVSHDLAKLAAMNQRQRSHERVVPPPSETTGNLVAATRKHMPAAARKAGPTISFNLSTTKSRAASSSTPLAIQARNNAAPDTATARHSFSLASNNNNNNDDGTPGDEDVLFKRRKRGRGNNHDGNGSTARKHHRRAAAASMLD